MLIFSIETSCDETSVCIMDDNKKIYSHIIYSQQIHKKFGGVVPELASRAHLEILQKITKNSLEESGKKISDIDVFAATCGPGLIGPLLIGSTFGKSLSLGCKKPFIPINHIKSHVLSPTFNNQITYPHLSILLTGGHTQIYFLDQKKNIILLGESIDDALGETFDKVAKILKLKYPGGPEIENWALKGNELSFSLPTPLLRDGGLNMSFSGLKTAINILVKKNKLTNIFISDICSSFQFCITKILIEKINRAIKQLSKESVDISSISIVGGVANNKYIINKLNNFAQSKDIKVFLPIKEMMSDNAAMIAWSAVLENINNADILFNPSPRLSI